MCCVLELVNEIRMIGNSKRIQLWKSDLGLLPLFLNFEISLREASLIASRMWSKKMSFNFILRIVVYFRKERHGDENYRFDLLPLDALQQFLLQATISELSTQTKLISYSYYFLLLWKLLKFEKRRPCTRDRGFSSYIWFWSAHFNYSWKYY